MKELYVVNCCRTAIGSFGGALKNTPAVDLGAIVIKEALNRAGVKPEQVDEVMFGCILTAAQGQNVARQASIKAGIPYSVPAYTVGMVCGSGMKSMIEGARSILAGDADVVVCGGTENMSAAPYAVPTGRYGARMGHTQMIDTMIKDGLWDAYNNYHMGTTAENIADIWGITRKEMDEFAASSQQKTEAAQKAGKFEAEIVPVPVKVKKDIVEFKVDEFPRAGVTAEGISKLKGAFPVGPESPNPQVVHTFEPTGIQETDDKGQQRVTAANASGINDGAAALVLASGEAVEKYGLKPMAKLIGWGQGGVVHLWRYMLIAPRIEKNLRRKVLEAYEQAKRLYHNDEKREFLVPGEQKILAVSGITRWPTWEEVCETKQRYWEPEEVAVQFNLSSDEDLNEEHIILLWDASDMLLPSKEIV